MLEITKVDWIYKVTMAGEGFKNGAPCYDVYVVNAHDVEGAVEAAKEGMRGQYYGTPTILAAVPAKSVKNDSFMVVIGDIEVGKGLPDGVDEDNEASDIISESYLERRNRLEGLPIKFVDDIAKLPWHGNSAADDGLFKAVARFCRNTTNRDDIRHAIYLQGKYGMGIDAPVTDAEMDEYLEHMAEDKWSHEA